MAPLDYRSRAVTLDDIVFEDRNRRYGAYWLRTHYNEHVAHGLLWASLAVLVAIVGPIAYKYAFPAEVVVPEKEVIFYIDPPPSFTPTLPPVPPMPPPSVKMTTPTTMFVPPVIVAQDVLEKVPTMEDLKKSAPGANTSTGNPNASLFGGAAEGVPNGKDFGLDQPAAAQPDFTVAELMPLAEFDYAAYIAKNVVYPAQDIRNEVSGYVYVNFRVAADGSVQDARVVKGISPTADAEALRVIVAMPNWVPGKQNGKPVNVRMTVPVRFRLN